MKNIFKKIAVVALAMIMCVGAVMPAASAAESKCPGTTNIHTSVNCDYVVIAQTEASCEVEGTVTGKCNGCGTTFVVNSVEKLGHDWDEVVASCEAESTKTCKRCGTVETIKGTMSSHNYGEWITKGDKGCYEGNIRYHVCSICGDVKDEEMKEAHSWVIAVYREPANCLVPGKATYICENSGCDAKKTADIWSVTDEKTHNYQDWTVVDDETGKSYNNPLLEKWIGLRSDPNAATWSCTKDGAHTQVCVDCGVTRIIYDAASTYEHTLKDMKFTNATLPANGCEASYKKPVWECYECGIMFDDKTVSDPDEDLKDRVIETYYAKNGTTSPVYTKSDYDSMTDDQKAEYYEIYKEFQWKDPAWYKANDPDVIFVKGDIFNKVTKPATIDGKGHSGKTEVFPTCETAGYTEIDCKKCGTYSFKNVPALGHLYYGGVSSSKRVTVAKDLGIDKNISSSNWTALGNVGKANGENGNVWDIVYLPTCTESAKIVWCCLNVDKNAPLEKRGNKYIRYVDGEEVEVSWQAYTQCSATKEASLTGTRNKAYGHDLGEDPDEELIPVSCTYSGIYDYKCTGEVLYYEYDGSVKVIKNAKYLEEGAEDTDPDVLCDYVERVIEPELGHKWVKDESKDGVVDGNVQVTCKQDGVQWYVCDNEGCSETKKEDIASSDAAHKWKYIYGDNEYNTQDEVYAAANANCTTEINVYRYCSEPKCKIASFTEAYTLPAKGHKFIDLDEDAIKFIKKDEDKVIFVDEDGELYETNEAGTCKAAERVAEGDCTTSAIYKLCCLRSDCNITSLCEPDKDNVKEKHDIQVVSTLYDINGIYDPNANEKPDDGKNAIVKLSCVEETQAYYWYCKDKTCSKYRAERFSISLKDKGDSELRGNVNLWVDKDGNPADLIAFTYHPTHLNPETGKEITYKDVPDERISGAESLEEARKVKAPVDENGNITAYAIEIPGTTLVWRYVADVSCDNDAVVAGGFYCVACGNTTKKNSDNKSVFPTPEVQIGDTRSAYHKLEKGVTIDKDCLSYGYTPYRCVNCDYTEQRDYEPKRDSHLIDEENPISVTKPTCETAGASIYQCGYNNCRQFVTVVVAPIGHVNIGGDKLLASCLDKNAYIDNRRCNNCNKIIFAAHNYVDGRCKECGAPEEN